MEGIIQKHVDAGTLAELMLCWNASQSEKNGESFIEAFMNDADHGQAVEYLPKIIDSLTARAQALGVYNSEFAAHRTAVREEVTSSDGFFGALACNVKNNC